MPSAGLLGVVSPPPNQVPEVTATSDAGPVDAGRGCHLPARDAQRRPATVSFRPATVSFRPATVSFRPATGRA